MDLHHLNNLRILMYKFYNDDVHEFIQFDMDNSAAALMTENVRNGYISD